MNKKKPTISNLGPDRTESDAEIERLRAENAELRALLNEVWRRYIPETEESSEIRGRLIAALDAVRGAQPTTPADR